MKIMYDIKAGDMIVNLYWRPIWRTKYWHDVRRIFPSDKENLLEFIKKNFPQEKEWLMEAEYAWSHNNVFIACHDDEIIGFACYDSSGKGYFGPLSVVEQYQRKEVGTELFYACLDAMKNDGYGYAIIGWVGSATGFYTKASGAYHLIMSSPCQTIYSRKTSIEPQYESCDPYGIMNERIMTGEGQPYGKEA